MSLILVIMIVVYIILMLRTYSNFFHIIIVNTIIYSVLLAAFVYGNHYFSSYNELNLFGKEMTLHSFYLLIGGWFVLNVITSFKIYRSFLEYKRVNTKHVYTENNKKS